MGRWVESCRARREACQFASPVFGQHNAGEVEQVRMLMRPRLGLMNIARRARRPRTPCAARPVLRRRFTVSSPRCAAFFAGPGFQRNRHIFSLLRLKQLCLPTRDEDIQRGARKESPVNSWFGMLIPVYGTSNSRLCCRQFRIMH